MLIVGENILLHFMDPICLPAAQTLVVFLHPGDRLLDFFGLPRAHCGGSLKQARWWRAGRREDAVIVLSGGGDVVVKGVVAAAIGKGRCALR